MPLRGSSQKTAQPRDFYIQACQRGVKRVYWTGKMRDFSVTESRNAHGEEARI